MLAVPTGSVREMPCLRKHKGEQRSLHHLDQTIALLHKMRVAVNNLPPDAAIDFDGCTRGKQDSW
jgi:hypothetical protein